MLTSRYRHFQRLRRQAINEGAQNIQAHIRLQVREQLLSLAASYPQVHLYKNPPRRTRSKRFTKKNTKITSQNSAKKPNKIHLHLVKTFKNVQSKSRNTTEEEEQNHTTMNKNDNVENRKLGSAGEADTEWEDARKTQELRVGYK